MAAPSPNLWHRIFGGRGVAGGGLLGSINQGLTNVRGRLAAANAGERFADLAHNLAISEQKIPADVLAQQALARESWARHKALREQQQAMKALIGGQVPTSAMAGQGPPPGVGVFQPSFASPSAVTTPPFISQLQERLQPRNLSAYPVPRTQQRAPAIGGVTLDQNVLTPKVASLVERFPEFQPPPIQPQVTSSFAQAPIAQRPPSSASEYSPQIQGIRDQGLRLQEYGASANDMATFLAGTRMSQTQNPPVDMGAVAKLLENYNVSDPAELMNALRQGELPPAGSLTRKVELPDIPALITAGFDYDNISRAKQLANKGASPQEVYAALGQPSAAGKIKETQSETEAETLQKIPEIRDAHRVMRNVLDGLRNHPALDKIFAGKDSELKDFTGRSPAQMLVTEANKDPTILQTWGPGQSPIPFGVSTLEWKYPGTDYADFAALWNQLNGQVFLQAFQKLKGGGTITEVEGEQARRSQSSASILGTKENFLDALDSLDRINRVLVHRSRMKAGLGNEPLIIELTDGSRRTISKDQLSNLIPYRMDINGDAHFKVPGYDNEVFTWNPVTPIQ